MSGSAPEHGRLDNATMFPLASQPGNLATALDQAVRAGALVEWLKDNAILT
jgi:hypothetical protein